VTIRAYGAEERLKREFLGSLDNYGRAWFAWLIANRWIGFRLDMLSFTVLVFAAFGAVATSDTIDPGLAGIALTYAIMLSGGFQYLVRQSARAETMMTSVERMLYYTTLPREGEWEDPPGTSLPANWPRNGSIEVKGLKARYREDLPIVLKGLDFEVPSGCKVGVVGRTGSGKSSLLNALLRLNQVVDGSIVIDDVDVLKVGLHTLRRQIAWIPQEPHLFTGTLRHNLDPFSTASDKDLWRALKAVQLDSTVKSLKGKLEAMVSDGGSNFSVGQRQLLSLARAIISYSKVVVMDEATANIDLDTDSRIQTAIKDGDFKHCTILMIAHRIRTIADCDLIVVMDNGRVAECGSPVELASTQGSIFSSMVEASGMSVQDLGRGNR